jgi:protein phosphatase
MSASPHPAQWSDKPLPSQIDVFGLTHTGRVRQSNADHFLVASFHRLMRVHASSMPVESFTPLAAYTRGFLFLVADGVGAMTHAAAGSAHAIQSVANWILEMAEATMLTDPAHGEAVAERLKEAILNAHQELLALDLGNSAATTLTLWIGLWPRAFVLHAGDSRCYRLRDGRLERLTSDQTMAEAMIAAGALKPGSPGAERLSHVLVSALGSSQMTPQMLVTDIRREDVTLLCSDGLTRHVSEGELRDALVRCTDAEATTRELIDLALERGGEDNVTAILGRIRPRTDA